MLAQLVVHLDVPPTYLYPHMSASLVGFRCYACPYPEARVLTERPRSEPAGEGDGDDPHGAGARAGRARRRRASPRWSARRRPAGRCAGPRRARSIRGGLPSRSARRAADLAAPARARSGSLSGRPARALGERRRDLRRPGRSRGPASAAARSAPARSSPPQSAGRREAVDALRHQPGDRQQAAELERHDQLAGDALVRPPRTRRGRAPGGPAPRSGRAVAEPARAATAQTIGLGAAEPAAGGAERRRQHAFQGSSSLMPGPSRAAARAWRAVGQESVRAWRRGR